TEVISRPSSNNVTTSSRMWGGAGGAGAGVAGSVTGLDSIIASFHGPDAAARLRRDPTNSAPPVPLPLRRPDYRVRSRQTDRRHQERLAERAIPLAFDQRHLGVAADDSYRNGRSGRRDHDS